jgi:DNA-binding transcriptional LysR family regulator
MQSLRGILNFARTAELGSFAAAARELGVSPVAVSQNISRLELNLGVRLFARSTRALQLTPEGQAFLEQCKAPLAQLDAACKGVANDAQHASGKLRATIVSPVAFLYLIPLLPKFFARYPDIQLELELSTDRETIRCRHSCRRVKRRSVCCATAWAAAAADLCEPRLHRSARHTENA